MFHRLQVGVIGQRMHYIVGRVGLFLCGFIFKFEVFFKWYEGVEGFGIVGQGATIVIRTSWFNRSSWILTKEMLVTGALQANHVSDGTCDTLCDLFAYD
ncbi:hypothetical protein BHM03_00035926 [Ensete ventricosum]|nr:hypothetical protein BHM03_00035926 [Ensete ventricosum]